MRFWGLNEIFIFRPIIMGFFSLDSSQWELSELLQPIFLSLTIFEIQGTLKGKNAIFEATSNFYFSSNFDGIFFIGFLSMRAIRMVPSRFFLSLTVFEIQGAQKGMLTYRQAYHFSQTHYCVKQVLEAYLFLCTLLLSTCCGRIMLRLRSPSVLNYSAKRFLNTLFWHTSQDSIPD